LFSQELELQFCFGGTLLGLVGAVEDAAIQIHGATGVSQWTSLASLYADIRHLRFADGPDEVHHMVVGRAEVLAYDLW
jgi:alkylation response protein AidB-like acyl-CoA dehydrogenase